jgi:hypothetical protein
LEEFGDFTNSSWNYQTQYNRTNRTWPYRDV